MRKCKTETGKVTERQRWQIIRETIEALIDVCGISFHDAVNEDRDREALADKLGVPLAALGFLLGNNSVEAADVAEWITWGKTNHINVLGGE